MEDSPPEDAEPPINFRGKDVRTLSKEELLEAIRQGFAEILTLRQRLSEEGRLEAAREEDFARELRERNDFFGTVAEFQGRLFDTSAAYNQLIVLGGYAAFFTVWSTFAGDIDHQDLVAAGVLMLVSLVVYVGWTVVGMYRLQAGNIAAMNTFEGGVQGFRERFQAAVAVNHEKGANLLRFWRPVVWVSGLTGFAAALLLGGAALQSIERPAKSMARGANQEVDWAKRAAAAAQKAECNAKTAELYARSRGGPGSTATNAATGQKAILVSNRWVIVPTC